MKSRWFVHAQHGYMLRAPSGTPGYDFVVTSVCQNAREIEDSADEWKRHKSRLRVNGGCGAVALSEDRTDDRNPAFAAIDGRKVPTHIRQDFLAAVAP